MVVDQKTGVIDFYDGKGNNIGMMNSPFRLNDGIIVGDVLGDDKEEIIIVREITKIYEEIIRGTTSEVAERLEKNPIKGEIVLIVKALED